MDFTISYDYIAESEQVTNMDKCFALYYDETNNPRTFRSDCPKSKKAVFHEDENKLFFLRHPYHINVANTGFVKHFLV